MDNKFGSSTTICRQWSHTCSNTRSLPSQRLALVSRSQINIRHNLTYLQCPLQRHRPSLTSTHPTWITARANTPTRHPTPPASSARLCTTTTNNINISPRPQLQLERRRDVLRWLAIRQDQPRKWQPLAALPCLCSRKASGVAYGAGDH